MPTTRILTRAKQEVIPEMLACIHPEGVIILGKSLRHADKTVGHYMALKLTLEHANDLYGYLGKIWPIGQIKSKQYYSTKTLEG
jgi:hypothetical protein